MIKTILALLSAFSLLSALLVVPVYAHDIPTNTTNPHRELQRHLRRNQGRETARLHCSHSGGFQQTPDSWKACLKLFYDQYKSDRTDFLKDLLWAPAQWHSTIFTDKQCPQQWHRDGCHIVIDCINPTPISYKTIYLLLKQVVETCIRKQPHRGGLAFVADKPRVRHWWMVVSGMDMGYGAVESSRVQQETMRRTHEGILFDFNVLEISEPMMIQKLSKIGPNLALASGIPGDLPEGWEGMP